MRVVMPFLVGLVVMQASPPALIAAGAPPKSYLLRVVQTLEACRKDIPGMAPAAEAAAARLAAGGNLYGAGQPSLVSELSGRAGGFLTLKSLPQEGCGENDVVLCAATPDSPIPQSLRDSKAYVVVFGASGNATGFASFSNHAEECGISPTLANAIPAWVFTGELIAALTRLGKMPIILESIGIYGGAMRNAELAKTGCAFHEKHAVPRVPEGVIGNRFLDAIGAMLQRVEKEERADLDRAGAWAAKANKAGRRTIMYSMGHLFPDEVGKTEIGRLFESAVWNAGFRGSPMPDDTYGPGDVIVHIAYQHPPLELFPRALPAGARVVYVSVLWARDYARDRNVIWIDPMWPWVDACVPLEGYEVPLLASSGIVNGAIAWEIYRIAKEHGDK